MTIGHGVEEIARAMAEQASRLGYVHSSQFHVGAAEKLAQRILASRASRHARSRPRLLHLRRLGGHRNGDKASRQYWLERGDKKRVSRDLAIAELSWRNARRALRIWQCPPSRALRPSAFGVGTHRAVLLLPLPLRPEYPECNVDCADDLERLLARDGHDDVAAFIFEPVSGATLGAVAPPDGYVQRIAEICRRHQILFIADEVMTGMGRTGKPFAVQHWGVVPDMILVGKGIASGYAPLGAVIAAGHVAETISRGSGSFLHGFTYNSHPVAAAAGNAVLDYIERENLFARVEPAGQELRAALERLNDFRSSEMFAVWACCGPSRSSAIRKRASRFPPDARIAARIDEDAIESGVLTYPMQGCVDGTRGDHILLAPPFTITSGMIQMLATALEHAVADLERTHLAGMGGSSALV